MRQLTETLEAAQKQSVRTPFVKVRASNKSGGAIKQKWTRLYTGTEPDYYHGLTVPGDGSLIRVRLGPVSDNRKIYFQRVSSPGPGSDYSQWTYTGQYDAVMAAAASNGAEVSIVWIKNSKEIKRIKSTDYGATWGSAEYIDSLQTTAINGLAAAYKPNGDLAIFFADQSTLYVKKCTGGQWQTKAAWDKTTGVLSGVGCTYDGDWNVLVTGKDTAGNYKIWGLVYGDGNRVAAGSWSALREVASAPAGGDFAYKQPFLDKLDTYRCFFVETFSGTEAYNRPFQSYIVPGTNYDEGLWLEPSPFNISLEYGLAMGHFGENGWLSSPNGVWNAPINEHFLDITADVISARLDLNKKTGALTIELNNEDGNYAFPGQDDLEILELGNSLEFSPGYITPEGEEYSEGQYFTISSFEHVNTGGKASLFIHGADGWTALENWQARCQLRWNKNGDDFNVEEIIKTVLAKAGLHRSVISQSAVMTGFYPDFTVNPGNNGRDVIRKLLSFVPDTVFIEGNIAYLVNPQPDDSSIYGYGTGHAILEGRYGRQAGEISRVQVEGWDAGAGKLILVESFNWDEAGSFNSRLTHILDKNLNTVSEAGQRGAAVLRQAEIAPDNCTITVPVNCGQQLFDVIAVTDLPAGLNAGSKRITDMTLVYNTALGEYFQRLKLGRV